MNDAGEARSVAHTRGANFSLGFRLLPAARRRAVYAAYACCRIPDDIVDEASAGSDSNDVRHRLDDWTAEVEAAYAGRPSQPATRALAAVLGEFPIPKSALLALVDGCRMDLERSRWASFAELERYCELVAVTISDISLAVFGGEGPEAHARGRDLAMALQLTNICRDVGEDLGRGRIYLPLDELERFKVAEADLVAGRVETLAYRTLMAWQCGRARDFFRAANPLPKLLAPDARGAVRVMGGVYRRVCERVARDPVRAFAIRTELPRWQRLTTVARGLLGADFIGR